MSILGIDPGPRQSGWALLASGGDTVLASGTWSNERLLARVCEKSPQGGAQSLVVEQPVGYGARAGLDLMNTAIWAGRYVQAWEAASNGLRPWRLLSFAEVAHAIVGRRGGVREADAWVAVLDLFGGQGVATGARKCPTCKGRGWAGRGRPPCTVCDASGWRIPPGPLHGVQSHARSAVACVCAARILEGEPVGTP
jgi:hypothetical protein